MEFTKIVLRIYRWKFRPTGWISQRELSVFQAKRIDTGKVQVKCVMYIYTSFTSNTKGNVYNGIAVESSFRANYEFLIQSLEINRSAYRIFVSRFFDSLAVYNLDKIWHTVARREKVAQGYAELGFSFFFSFSFFLPSTCVSFYVTKKKEEVYIIANVAA